MTTKENAPVFETEAPSSTTPAHDTPDQKPVDPLVAWHALAAPAKAKMRGKHRRNARRDAIGRALP